MNVKRALMRALMEDATVTVEEAAIVLGLSRNHAYDAVRAGQIPSIRIGRAIRIPCVGLRKMLGFEETAV
jgi:excisionase family DNA binding protein